MKRPSQRTTISDVARAAQVSPATVSLILNGRRNGDDRISDETRQRVLRAVASLGYVPNQTARSQRRRKTERVCLYVARLGVPYYDLLAQALQQAADERGYTIIVSLGFGPAAEHRVLDQLMRGLADGVVLIRPSYLTSSDLSALARTGTAVLVHSDHLGGEGVDAVRVTEAEASYEAMEYLYAQGHRRIAFIGPAAGDPIQVPRYRSYARFMAEHDLPVVPDMVQDDNGISRRHAYECAQALLSLPSRPTAIFTGSDLAAISAIWAIRNAGLRVPDDIAVIGSGNIPEGTIMSPPLTTIGHADLDFSVFVDFLFSRLAGNAPIEGREHIIPWTLIRRGSA